jgi:NADH-quinone oxidoreductase subunit C/D
VAPGSGDVVEKLKNRFPGAVLDASEFRGETTVTLRAGELLKVARFLRDEPGLRYAMLTDLCGLDRLGLGVEPRFATIYQLYSLEHNRRLRLKAPLEGDPPTVRSVVEIWPTANWHERETYDLMGIVFQGHPYLRRIMLPEGWAGHPLRKDYPLGGEEVPFSRHRDDPRFDSLGRQILAAPSKQSPLPPEVDEKKHLVVNMGPQHPSTHGVLRLAVELDGEQLVSVNPELGYLHSGFEKTAEAKTYQKFIPYTDRVDYVAAMSNNLAYVLTVEKLLDVEIPPRAQYVRVILTELQRIVSHLLWISTHAMDLAGMGLSMLIYGFRERESVLDIFEMLCGARLTTSYFRVGGLSRDAPPAFAPAVRRFIDEFPKRLDEYEAMLTRNPIWLSRLKGIGRLSAEQAIALGVTGPMLRGSGVPYDLRKARPYSSYDHFDFEIPTAQEGDCYARYLVRFAEMRQSLRIIRQALDNLPGGPYKTSDRKVALPPREELPNSMESLIHHFKLVTEGLSPPPGEVYNSVESPKGELGYYLVSDGGPKPYRLRIRGPCFVNLQATDLMARGHLLSDLVAIIGSIDIVLGEVDR